MPVTAHTKDNVESSSSSSSAGLSKKVDESNLKKPGFYFCQNEDGGSLVRANSLYFRKLLCPYTQSDQIKYFTKTDPELSSAEKRKYLSKNIYGAHCSHDNSTIYALRFEHDYPQTRRDENEESDLEDEKSISE